MAEVALKREVDSLREYMKELSYQSMRTDMAINRLTEEMREFKDEMREFKITTERTHQRMNKQWGDLANRLGTLVEDIVAPNLPRIAAELFACTVPDLFAVRVVRRFGGETREYDALVVCDDLVLVNETKSRLLSNHVEQFTEKLAEFARVYPEYAERRIIGILAGLYPDGSVVNQASRKGILVMGMGEDNMQVLNPEAVKN